MGPHQSDISRIHCNCLTSNYSESFTGPKGWCQLPRAYEDVPGAKQHSPQAWAAVLKGLCDLPFGTCVYRQLSSDKLLSQLEMEVLNSCSASQQIADSSISRCFASWAKFD